MAGVSEGQMATWRLHRRRGEAYPYYNAIAAASLVAQYSGTDPALNISSVLPAGTFVNINGSLYVTRNVMKYKEWGEVDPLNWHPSYIIPKATGVTFADRDAVYWDETACNCTSVSTNKFIGYAVSNSDLGTTTNGTSGALTTGTATNAAYEVASGTSADGLVGAYATGDTFMEVEVVCASTVTNKSAVSAVAAVTALGTVIANAVNVAQGFSLVAGGNNAVGVKLPLNPAVGTICWIKNNGAGGLFVYPAVNAAINALGANNSINMATVTSAAFVAYTATQWYTVPLLPS